MIGGASTVPMRTARIRLLEILVHGERTVQELQDALTLDQPTVSQQLAVRDTRALSPGRRKGSRCGTRCALVGELLDVARRIFNNHLVTTRGLLRELQREVRRG